MSAFLAMGGYGAYVWPSFLITFGIIAVNIVAARRASARALEEARRRVAVEDSR
jgi:heme exporter protein D